MPDDEATSRVRLVHPVRPSRRPPDDQRPELSDLGRYGRMLVRRFVSQARAAEQPTFRSIIADHLGVDRRRPAGRRGALAGVRARQRPGGARRLARRGRIASIGSSGSPTTATAGRSGWPTCSARPRDASTMHGPRPGNVTRTSLPSGPAGETRECLRAAVVLVAEGEDRLAILFRGADPESDLRGVTVEVVATRPELAAAAHRDAARAGARAQRLPRPGRVVRPQHVRRASRSLLRFHERPQLSTEDDLILPPRHLRRRTPTGRRGRAQQRAAAGGRAAPQARTAALRPAGRRQDPHRALPRRASWSAPRSSSSPARPSARSATPARSRAASSRR